MIYSTDRILTAHAGSLPRPDALREMVLAKARGEPIDQAALNARLKSAVAEIVKRQVKRNWYNLIPESVLFKKGEVSIQFSILKDNHFMIEGESQDIVVDTTRLRYRNGCHFGRFATGGYNISPNGAQGARIH